MAKKPPSNSFLRSHKLVTAIGRYAVGEVKRKIKAEKNAIVSDGLRRQALNLIDSLDQLKGFPLKLGQLLSIDTAGILPDEIRVLFEKLQNQATPVNSATMEKVVASELGDQLLELEVDWRPLASASLGQVYQARFGTEELVLKVQYPDIDKSLDGDLLVLRKIIPLLSKLAGRSLDWNEVFAELSDMFRREIDYERELKMLQLFKQQVANDDPWYVPEAYEQFSSRRVIAMERLKGVTFTEWMANAPSESERYFVAHSCLELFCRELFDWGIVQTDPNFANFLILDSGKIGLIDFGASLEYGEGFVAKYRSLLNALAQGNPQEVIRLSVEFNLLDERESEAAKLSYLKMVEVSVAPFLLQGEFDFTSADHIQQSKETSLEFLRLARYTPPPRHLIFLHRKLGGLYSLLAKLNVQIDLRAYWNKWIAKSESLTR